MSKKLFAVFLLLAMSAIFTTACQRAQPYEATFDEVGTWAAGDEFNVSGGVADGVYTLTVDDDIGAYWTTADETFTNGIFEVEATQVAGPLDAGYGLMIRVNDDSESFYLLEVSGDGFVWVGLCENACEDETILVGENPAGWFPSDAVNQGLNATNTLRVEAEGGNLIFYVNGSEIGRKTDTTLAAGDIGLLVETLGFGGVTVAFDNVSVTPSP